eukprot:11221531-Lingulodinium_polyedra.AAC.1
MRFPTAMRRPFPRIRLLLAGRRGQTGMPILSARFARSCGLNFVERFLAGANVEESQAASDAEADLNEM